MALNKTHQKFKKEVKKIKSFIFENELYERNIYISSKVKFKYDTFSTSSKKTINEAEVVSLLRQQKITDIKYLNVLLLDVIIEQQEKLF